MDEDEEVWPPESPRPSDDEVAEVERDLVDEDYLGPDARQQVKNLIRLRADGVLYHELVAADFSGTVFEVFLAELTAYGIAVMMSWTRTGKIIPQCRAVGRPLELSGYGPGRWTREDRLELSMETVTKALRVFVDDVLPSGRWDPAKGASLKTFFIGACRLQFPNVFNTWARGEARWQQIDGRVDPAEVEQRKTGTEACWSDPTGDTTARRDLRNHLLGQIQDPKTRRIAELLMAGYTHKEAGAQVGLSPEAVGERLRRLRKKFGKGAS